jgi:hypothetical protein
VPAGVALCQRLQQGLGLLEVGGIKALSEPPVDGHQQLAGLVVLALQPPQTAEAHVRPQLPGFGLLPAGHGEGLLEAGVRLGRIWPGLAQQEFAPEPVGLHT